MRRKDDAFIYEPVVVPSFEDALIAVLFNHNIQAAVVIRYDFQFHVAAAAEDPGPLPAGVRATNWTRNSPPRTTARSCAASCSACGPELDVYLVTDRSVEDIAGSDLGGCARVFYNREDYMELHLNILRGVNQRYQTPFFTALKNYSKQPTGVFHAMPLSRGKSVSRSNWIRDMLDFYGLNIFLAETSATSGGLDSLLEPVGPIKRAQELAARAFGSRKTFFATNGTSTCNKIVVQAIVRPGDIVLVDRDCHKSHHYGMVLAGAEVVYLDSYPLSEYSMYGAVPLREIKHRLLELQGGRQARPRAHAAADQLHLRRPGLQRRARDGGVPGDQAGPGLPVGRGLVRLRALRPHLPPAHRDALRAAAARALPRPGLAPRPMRVTRRTSRA